MRPFRSVFFSLPQLEVSEKRRNLPNDIELAVFAKHGSRYSPHAAFVLEAEIIVLPIPLDQVLRVAPLVPPALRGG